jgi:hypothetical protein
VPAASAPALGVGSAGVPGVGGSAKLAKERATDCSIPYKEYLTRFSRASEELVAYGRPLAEIIGSIVDFHFNHFQESSCKGSRSRLGPVASRFAAWVENREQIRGPHFGSDLNFEHLEILVTEWDTEQIIRWGARPLDDLRRNVSEIEGFLNRDLAEYDKVKLHILLGEIYAAVGEKHNALKHAKALRNLAALEKWAENVIRVFSEDEHESRRKNNFD